MAWSSAVQKKGETIEEFGVRIANHFSVAKQGQKLNEDYSSKRIFMNGLLDHYAAEQVRNAKWRETPFFDIVGMAMRAQEKIPFHHQKGGIHAAGATDEADGGTLVGAVGQQNRRKPRRTQKCYICGSDDHLVRTCPHNNFQNSGN